MRIGAVLPTRGELPSARGVPAMAAVLEAAGYDSLWVLDHVVFPRRVQSPYPGTPDGSLPVSMRDAESPWFEAVISLCAAGMATATIELGTAVVVLAQREPLLFAKQVATVQAIVGRKLSVGVGAGWLAEEFDALGVEFGVRGERLDEAIELVRAAWTGSVGPYRGRQFEIGDEVLCFPVPFEPPDILVGGWSEVARRRAARHGAGWMPLQMADALDPEAIRSGIARVEELRGAAANGLRPRVALRIGGLHGHVDKVAASLRAFTEAGVTDVIVDVPWDDDAELRRTRTLLAL